MYLIEKLYRKSGRRNNMPAPNGAKNFIKGELSMKKWNTYPMKLARRGKQNKNISAKVISAQFTEIRCKGTYE